MNDNQASLNFNMIKTWTVEALKDFLRLRGIRTTGSKEMLVARAFFAFEQQIPIQDCAIELDKKRAAEYQHLLNTSDEGKLPDPVYDLTENWVEGSDVIFNLPNVTFVNFVCYLNAHRVLKIVKILIT